MRAWYTAIAALTLLLAWPIGLTGGAARAETVALDQIEHIHGLAAGALWPGALYVATHTGLFLASPDGTASRVGRANADFMSFATQPDDPDTLYASGHPPGGGNLGIVFSRDGGRTWEPLSAGVNGPVDFHAMAVSRADPQVMYGMFKGLQMSRDGGRTWHVAGTLPKETFDLAASASDPNRLYAGAMGGLFVSDDAGASWLPMAGVEPRPTPMVHVAKDGRVYAFLYETGLIAFGDGAPGSELLSSTFGERYLLHMASDPTRPELLHAVADTGAILSSLDGGRTWIGYEGHDRQSAEQVADAGRLYGRLCQSCHGDKGVGERPEDPNATDEYGFVAPSLDNSGHGWHHSDSGLAKTILNGSPRNPRMMPFGELISEDDAQQIVAYIKSLWNFNSLACQGARHMSCMH